MEKFSTDYWLVDDKLTEIKVKDKNGNEFRIPFNISANQGHRLIFTDQLIEDNVENIIKKTINNQQNILLMIRDFTFDLIDYAYIYIPQRTNEKELKDITAEIILMNSKGYSGDVTPKILNDSKTMKPIFLAQSPEDLQNKLKGHFFLIFYTYNF